jgi:hypothetical protein
MLQSLWVTSFDSALVDICVRILRSSTMLHLESILHL